MSKYTASGETPIRYECTKRKCKWQGTDVEKYVSEIEGTSMQELVCPKCSNNEFYGLREGLRFTHIETGNTGVFVKHYKPSGKPYTMQIKLDDGRIFFAPKSEFKQSNSNK
ncbi:hypothetical protein [Flavobacterium facile]|uniref:hypothetical protein n=1 Tax=Flavobacterium facile TaxID=2893174 RepID=UPI002E7A6EDC|nr:hypothetical protein [Flavobacterium sp. T-12]